MAITGNTQNIIDCFNRADGESVLEGGVWYEIANSWAEVVGRRVTTYGHNPLPNTTERIVMGAGIIAAFSPQTSWDNNKTMAWRFAETLDKPDWCTDVNYQKALTIVSSGSQNRTEYIDGCLGKEAYKTRAFFHNIVSPSGDYGPTIDRHAISIYMGRRCTVAEAKGGHRYSINKLIKDAYLQAANELQVHYNQVQAITWVQWRKEIKGE